ncbi:PTS sugar transporter subunit IIA [Klebsiella michiganensis]|uniref:PTS sugar transporter subunit IIA n=1 Tax=Klebsiella michiganensis TaxID=1134687 RepID=UPI000B48C8D1|nr:PTS fructose transporter subunit IIA [Klebsiella michiganensis]MBZ7431621.1 PTS fructose transporter subunit IIA [Klebsiella michiganensis]MDM4470430.1 PTS fructose transporter subunit IIA [Klebsiella michiganensis]MDU1366004.1 PTS fructose transporter subunit IIA [Klebsiella michiganensis]MDU5618096.1 PTS fructose transporter subunit IIA [Klebsiella michiganensis]MDU7321429.1 PTS fructose transporter subunit IIA [Klebsiella michiganensis]
MREMYIATHGRYAEGIVSALNLLIGDDHGVTPVCAYCGEIESTAELAIRFDAIARQAAGRGNELVLFTDMPGGSVNNTAVQMMVKYPHAHVISGASLIMLMEFCMSEHVETAQRLQDAVTAASGAMQYMNQLPEIIAARQAAQHKTQDNIDDFFAEEGNP